MDKSQKRNIYRISFLIPNEYNWVNISSISDETLNEFANYLYSLDRDIEVLPYIPGGLHCGICAYPELDRTYLVNTRATSATPSPSPPTSVWTWMTCRT